jgi:hypothetical protein
VVSVVAWSRTTGEMPRGHGFRPPKGSSEKGDRRQFIADIRPGFAA